MFVWLAYLAGIIYAFCRGMNMQKSIVFVFDIGKWVGAIALLLVLGCWAERTPIASPVKPAEETKRRPLFPILRGEMDDEAGSASSGKIMLGDIHPPDGSALQIDFPIERDMRNIRSRVDGQGMCVTTSAEMAADWAGLTDLKGFRDWCSREPGGCGPKKFDDQLRRFCKQKGIAVPNYLFYLGKSPEFLELVLRTGRMPAISYAGRDGVQYSSTIAHMTDLTHYARGLAGVYDNNYDPRKRIWLPEEKFLDRWIDGGNGWAIVWLDPPPPPRLKK